MKVSDLSPAPTEWADFNERYRQDVPETSGCYVCTDDYSTILYIGGSKTSIQDRYDDHLQSQESGESMQEVTRVYWHEIPAGEVLAQERAWYAQHVKATGKPPQYNDKKP